jgi:hypothetical protein
MADVWMVMDYDLISVQLFTTEIDAYKFAVDSIYENIRDTYGIEFVIPLPSGLNSGYAQEQKVNIDTIIQDESRTPQNKFQVLRNYSERMSRRILQTTKFPHRIDVTKMSVADEYTSVY